MNKIARLLLGLAFLSVAFAADTASVSAALSALCSFFNDILPVGIMLVIVLAGVVFAVGQTMGAETRARANVWATNLLIGALIAGAVYIIAPWFIGTITGKTLSTLC